MQIRWTFVIFIAVFAPGLTASMNRRTVAATTPQAPPLPARTAATAENAKDAAPISIPETTLAINSDKPMSQRVVHYQIDAKYDTGKHIVDAIEVLTYHNLTGQALDHFPFHLYQNAFQPKSTWVREAKIQGSRDTDYEKWEEKQYGSEEIKMIEVVGQGDLNAQLQYIAPDDGNKDDKTVIDLHLIRPIAPGAYVQFKIAFRTKFPETQGRCRRTKSSARAACWSKQRTIPTIPRP